MVGIILLVAFGILIGYAAWYKASKKKSKNKGGGGSSSKDEKPELKKRT